MEIHLRVFKTVISNLGHHRKTDESTFTLFDLTKIDLPLSPNSPLDIGKTFNLQLDPTITPSCIHPRIEVSYNLQVQIQIECGGQRFKEDFQAEDVQIMSNRTPNSPLRHNHLCIFSSENQQSSSAPPAYPGIDKPAELDISSAYLRLSRLLTQNFIPHSQVTWHTGEPAIKLHSEPQLPDSASSSASEPSSRNPFSLSAREDALKDDLTLLDSILVEENGYSAASMRSGRDALELFTYSWRPPGTSLKSRVRGISTILEISAPRTPSPRISDAPPPAYSTASDPFSPVALFNRGLRLIADSQHPDASFVSDVEYAASEFGRELGSRLGEVDARAAKDAVAKFEALRGPLLLMGLQVDADDVDFRGAWNEEKRDGKEAADWSKRRYDEKEK